MNDFEGRKVAPIRVSPQSVARLLPSVIVAWDDPVAPSLAGAALIAGVIEHDLDLPGSDCRGWLESAVRSVGEDYSQGFFDGFDSIEALRGMGRRYVFGLDDALAVRILLRKLPWGRLLLVFPGVTDRRPAVVFMTTGPG